MSEKTRSFSQNIPASSPAEGGHDVPSHSHTYKNSGLSQREDSGSIYAKDSQLIYKRSKMEVVRWRW